MKQAKVLEKYFKGAANHRRIDILNLIFDAPGITVEGIAEKLACDFQVVSVHARKLYQVGLIDKKYVGRAVGHTLSPYGHKFIRFIKTL